MNDVTILERNATAYAVVTTLFVGSLIAPTSAYFLFGVDENEVWPTVTAFLLSVILPVAYLSLRELRGGPGFDEILRYGELKDGWPRKWQTALFSFWVVFATVVVITLWWMSQPKG